jgi:hypothetical protein
MIRLANSDMHPFSRLCRSADGSLHGEEATGLSHADCRLHSGNLAEAEMNEFASGIRDACDSGKGRPEVGAPRGRLPEHVL